MPGAVRPFTLLAWQSPQRQCQTRPQPAGWGGREDGVGALLSLLDSGAKEAPGGRKLGGGETAKGKADQGTVLGGLRVLHGQR